MQKFRLPCIGVVYQTAVTLASEPDGRVVLNPHIENLCPGLECASELYGVDGYN